MSGALRAPPRRERPWGFGFRTALDAPDKGHRLVHKARHEGHVVHGADEVQVPARARGERPGRRAAVDQEGAEPVHEPRRVPRELGLEVLGHAQFVVHGLEDHGLAAVQGLEHAAGAHALVLRQHLGEPRVQVVRAVVRRDAVSLLVG